MCVCVCMYMGSSLLIAFLLAISIIKKADLLLRARCDEWELSILYYGKPKSGMIDCKMLSRPPHEREQRERVCTQQVNHIAVQSAKGKRAPPKRRRYYSNMATDILGALLNMYVGVERVSTCILGDVFEHALVYCRAQYWRKAARGLIFRQD